MLRAGIVARTGKSGGAEDYIVRLYDSLEHEGVSSVLYGEIGGWSPTGRSTVPIRLGDKWSRSNLLRSLVRLPKERAEVSVAVAQNPADLFHLHFKREQIGFTDVLKRHGPVMWTEHGRFGRGPYSRMIAALYAKAAMNVDAIACVSEYVASDVREITGLSSNVFVIPNSIDTATFRPPTDIEKMSARRRLNLDDDDVVLACVGRLESNKRPLLAIDLAKTMNGILLVAGTGSLEPQVRAAASNSGDRVRFLGQINNARDVYWAADVHIFLSSGAGEGFPTVLLEAAACGLPTLGVRGSGFEPEIASIGRVAADLSTTALSREASVLLEGRTDRALMAREWAMDFDVVPWAKRHRELMNQLQEGWNGNKGAA